MTMTEKRDIILKDKTYFCHVQGKTCQKFSLKYLKSNKTYQHNVDAVTTLCKTAGLKQRKCFLLGSWFLSYGIVQMSISIIVSTSQMLHSKRHD